MDIPFFTVTKEAFVIRIPRVFGVRKRKETKPAPMKKRENRPFEDLVGVLKDVPEFKGKTSVEVQHMISDLWGGKRI